MIINHNMSAIFAAPAAEAQQLGLDKNMEKLVLGHADQPGRRRRLRPGRVREDAQPDPRPAPGGAERAERHLLHPDHRGLPAGDARTSCSGSASWRCRPPTASTPTRTGCRSRSRSPQLVDEVDRIASHAQFNGMNLLTGRFARETGENVVTASMWFHIGANMDQRERVYIGTMTAERPRACATVGSKRDHLALDPRRGQQGHRHRSTRPSRWSTSSAPTSAPTRTAWSTP